MKSYSEVKDVSYSAAVGRKASVLKSLGNIYMPHKNTYLNKIIHRVTKG
jgi:hypothetical protein